ncbi:MAG: nucleotide exchange factor GrpE [Caldilineaceae bacterium]|nr:nucleotide exchange factor GrpE [Caldilineaceae bacterium]MBP8106800.1 nucleotide exchange factor GrpE [Caldilineaceae bacterium]MBP8124898.1 nucleotide exchange factor GrpE [Caldilineaceae bacterium]MBP9071813.1 nucleotide exchange factor GrpE [Caldilineaceae bacterium]
MFERVNHQGIGDVSDESVAWEDQIIPFADDDEDENDGLLVEDAQSQAHLRQLVAQNEFLQTQLAQLVDETQLSAAQVAALTRHFTGSAAEAARREHEIDLVSRLETLQEQLDELTKSVTKLGRTQFKANTLTESREQQVGHSLTALQEIATRRDEVNETRQVAQQRRLAQLRKEARGDLAADLLPSLDGLDMALAHGQQMLAEQRRREEAARKEAMHRPPPAPSVWDKVRRVFIESEPEPAPVTPPPAAGEMSDALSAWLQGLNLVQTRFVTLLGKESVQSIDALHKPFDPRLHVAVGAQDHPDLPANTVVTVLRKGYTQGDRVLRYAEVMVSRSAARDDAQD